MTIQTSVKLPDDLRTRLDQAAVLLARDRTAIIVEALDSHLSGLITEEEVRRQCAAANAADAQDDWEAFAEWPRD